MTDSDTASVMFCVIVSYLSPTMRSCLWSSVWLWSGGSIPHRAPGTSTLARFADTVLQMVQTSPSNFQRHDRSGLCFTALRTLKQREITSISTQWHPSNSPDIIRHHFKEWGTNILITQQTPVFMIHFTWRGNRWHSVSNLQLFHQDSHPVHF